jgi:hypothetical protein
VADDANPATLGQRAHDVGIHRHTADILDFAARDRLTVGDQRKRFEQGARVPRRPLLPEFRQAGGKMAPDLEAPTACDLDEFHRAALAVFGECGERLADSRSVRPLELLKDLAQLLDAERLSVGQQRGLDDALELCCLHGSPRQAVVVISISSSGTASGSRSTRRTCSG